MNLPLDIEAKVQAAIGDGSTWPSMTDDPIVNYYVDLRVDPDMPQREWMYLLSKDQQMYRDEANAFAHEMWYPKDAK